jgi:copper chaperone CopZ
MEKLTLDLPAMYGDHHVIEVRRILFGISGVEEVYASSGFQAVEVTYDPAQTDGSALEVCLAEAGYMEPLELPLEPRVAPYLDTAQPAYFRHTAAYRQTGRAVNFAQTVTYTGWALWPCPGMGPISRKDEGE